MEQEEPSKRATIQNATRVSRQITRNNSTESGAWHDADASGLQGTVTRNRAKSVERTSKKHCPGGWQQRRGESSTDGA